MSPIYYDLGLTPGMIAKPWITNIAKFIPHENDVPIEGAIAARLSCRIKFEEIPPQSEGVNLEIVNVKTYTSDGGLVDQTFDYT